MSWAWKQRVGSPVKKLILMHVADSYNDEKKASWFSVSRIAERCECDRKTVMRHLKALCETGIIALKERGNQHGKTNKYSINFEYEPSTNLGLPKKELVPQCHQPSPTVTPPLVPQCPIPSPTVGPKQERTVTIEQEYKQKGPKFVLPEDIPKDRFQEYLQMRISMRKRASDRAKSMVVDAIRQTSDETGLSNSEVLDEMLLRNWLSVKPDWIKKKPPSRSEESITDRAARLAGASTPEPRVVNS